MEDGPASPLLAQSRGEACCSNMRPHSRHGEREGRRHHCTCRGRAGNLFTILKVALPPKAGTCQSPHGPVWLLHHSCLVGTDLKMSQSSPALEMMCSRVQDPLWAMAGSNRGQDSRCTRDSRLEVLSIRGLVGETRASHLPLGSLG